MENNSVHLAAPTETATDTRLTDGHIIATALSYGHPVEELFVGFFKRELVEFVRRLEKDSGFASHEEDMPVAWGDMADDIHDHDRMLITDKELARKYGEKCYTLVPLFTRPSAPMLSDLQEREAVERSFNASKYMQVVYSPNSRQPYIDGWNAALLAAQSGISSLVGRPNKQNAN